MQFCVCVRMLFFTFYLCILFLNMYTFLCSLLYNFFAIIKIIMILKIVQNRGFKILLHRLPSYLRQSLSYLPFTLVPFSPPPSGNPSQQTQVKTPSPPPPLKNYSFPPSQEPYFPPLLLPSLLPPFLSASPFLPPVSSSLPWFLLSAVISASHSALPPSCSCFMLALKTPRWNGEDWAPPEEDFFFSTVF